MLQPCSLEWPGQLTDNQFDFYDRINGEDILNTERTNDFEYDENVNAAYANYAMSISSKWKIQAGQEEVSKELLCNYCSCNIIFLATSFSGSSKLALGP